MFAQRYAGATLAEAFVDALMQHMRQTSGADLSGQRGALIALYNSGASLSESRSLALRGAIEDASFKVAEYNKAFVLMQYFGYLKRDPEPDGYGFWLNVLDNKSADIMRTRGRPGLYLQRQYQHFNFFSQRPRACRKRSL